MKGLSIGVKLMIGFAAIVAVSLIGSVFSMYETSVSADDTDNMSYNLTQVKFLRDIEYGMYEATLIAERWSNPYLPASEFDDQFKEEENWQKVAVDALKNLTAEAKSENEAKHNKTATQVVMEFAGTMAKVVAMAKEGQQQGRSGDPKLAQEINAFLKENNFVQLRENTFAKLEEYTDYLDKDTDAISAISDYNARLASIIAIVSAVLVTLIGTGIAILFPRSITKVVSEIAVLLRTEADHVTSHSKELSAGSQALASGSSEQAASAEEIAASVEEVTSMVRQNADNASEADKLVEAARIAVDATQKSMQRSLAANEEISNASNETYKIVKTIDDIAFQTNLLSLNAAVEAARAGEAGAGFAVVASEVRGLSMRSAEASKRTAELIEQTIAKVKEGVEIFKETGANIDVVVDHVHKVAQLVTDVATASNEQGKGLSQINIGITEMGNVIQENAAQSEESAASTQELYSQAEEVLESVYKLEVYVLGDKAASK